MTVPDPDPVGSELAAPGVASASAAPVEQAGGGVRTVLTWVAGVLALVALMIGLLLWQRLGNMQEQLARQSAEAQAQSSEARALARQAVALAQETATRAAVLDARLSEVALQRSQLDELMRSLSRSRDENLVVDIDAALRLAQQQAQFTGSVEPLLAALKGAEQRVLRAAQPSLGLLQRAIGRDIDRVKSAAVSDTPNMLGKIDELVRLADELTLANAVGAAPARATQAPKPSTPEAGWLNLLNLVLVEARNLVRVSRVDAPEAMLLSPEQSFFIRENLKLKLLNARLGVLSRQIEAANADLQVADATLKKYFDRDARKSRTAAALLQQVQQQMRYLQVPRIDETLAVLATAAAGR